MGYFDPFTISLHILYTTNQETEGSQYWLTVYNMERLFFLLDTSCLSHPLGNVLCTSEYLVC